MVYHRTLNIVLCAIGAYFLQSVTDVRFLRVTIAPMIAVKCRAFRVLTTWANIFGCDGQNWD